MYWRYHWDSYLIFGAGTIYLLSNLLVRICIMAWHWSYISSKFKQSCSKIQLQTSNYGIPNITVDALVISNWVFLWNALASGFRLLQFLVDVFDEMPSFMSGCFCSYCFWYLFLWKIYVVFFHISLYLLFFSKTQPEKSYWNWNRCMKIEMDWYLRFF